MSDGYFDEFRSEVTALTPEVFIIHDEVQLSRKPQHVITILHGIRDRGGWALDLQYYSNRYGLQIDIQPISYGWLGVVPFLLRIKSKKIEFQVQQEMNQIYASNPDAVHSLISHSNGTKIASIVIKSIDFRYKNVIFCGSVCRRSEAPSPPSGADYIVNDCSPKDIWPLVAQIINPFSYEATGTYGFRRGGINDRFFTVSHGGCLTKNHFFDYILPIITSSTLKIGERPKASIPYFVPEYARIILALVLIVSFYYTFM